MGGLSELAMLVHAWLHLCYHLLRVTMQLLIVIVNNITSIKPLKGAVSKTKCNTS